MSTRDFIANFEAKGNMERSLAKMDKLVQDFKGKLEDAGSAFDRTAQKGKDAGEKIKTGWTELKSKIDLVVGALRVLRRAYDATAGAALEQSRIFAQMNATLERSGMLTANSSRQFDIFADRIQRTTRVGDDATAVMTQQVLGVTQGLNLAFEEVLGLTELSLNITEATGRSMETVSMALARIRGGEFTAARRLLPGMTQQLQDLAEAGGTGEEAIALIAEAFEDAAQAGGPLDIQAARLGNTFGDLGEELGDVIVEGVEASGMVGTLQNLVDRFIQLLQQNRGSAVQFFRDVADAIELAALAAGFLAEELAKLPSTIFPDRFGLPDIHEELANWEAAMAAEAAEQERLRQAGLAMGPGFTVRPGTYIETASEREAREFAETYTVVPGSALPPESVRSPAQRDREAAIASTQYDTELGPAAPNALEREHMNRLEQWDEYNKNRQHQLDQAEERERERRADAAERRREEEEREATRLLVLQQRTHETKLEMIREHLEEEQELRRQEAAKAVERDNQIEANMRQKLEDNTQWRLDQAAKALEAEELAREANIEAQEAGFKGMMGIGRGMAGLVATITGNRQIEYVVEGMGEIARVAQSIAAFDPLGATLHGIAAAKFFAAAATAGKASKKTVGAPGSGGGGFGGGLGQRTTPDRSRSESGFEGFSGLTININAPQQNGYEVARHTAEGLNKFGRLNSGLTLNPNLLPSG